MENAEKKKSIIFEKIKKSSQNVLNQKFLRSRKLKILIIGMVILLITYNLIFIYIKPNEFGIKVVNIGRHPGVQKKVYMAGLHLISPFGIQKMYTFPKDLQVLDLFYTKSSKNRNAVHIQTSDGFFVDVDVSIIYRIVDPYKSFTILGPGNLFEDNGIIPMAEPVLKVTMGKLRTEEFYDSSIRSKKELAAKEMLNGLLMDKGLRVEYVLVRYFKYSDEIQKNIEEMKLKDQLVFKNQAEAKAAIEQAKLKQIEQEGIMLLEVEHEKGRAYVTRKKAEKDLYFRKKKAEATLLVKLAEAEKVRLKNDALKGVGAERMIGLKMADVFKGLDIVILPSDGSSGMNPFDLNGTLKLFNLREGDAK